MRLHVDIEKNLQSFRLKVSFDTDGEVFAVLGASGCGKSMTLKCIAGIERPDRGVITLGERVLFDSSSGIDLPPQKRRIGYLFQDYALFPHMTVLENISCGSKEKAAEYIRRFYLNGKEDLLPHQLSGGEKQRTAIARMLASEPELVMLDEPLSALDGYLKSNMEEELACVIDDFGGQALLVSHDREEIYRLADRIAVLDQGQVTCVQEKKELFSSPASMAAARLTGCENVSSLSKDGAGGMIAQAWGIRLPYAMNTKGVKPEHCFGQMPKHVAFRARDVLIIQGCEVESKARCPEDMVLLCPAKPENIRIIEDMGGLIARVQTPGGGYISCMLPKEEKDRIYARRGMYFAVPCFKLMFFDH